MVVTVQRELPPVPADDPAGLSEEEFERQAQEYNAWMCSLDDEEWAAFCAHQDAIDDRSMVR
jgi:hypothetical protein